MFDSPGQIVLDFSTASRASHPSTSRIAEELMNKSGKRSRHCQIIFNALKMNNGSTSAELATHTNLTKEQVHKRMHDLEEHDYIKRGTKRICRVKSSQCLTWWVTVN
jgi:predicted transcriptional regulator